MIKRILCWFGTHRWKNIDTTPLPELKEGESYCYSDLHKCERCGKEEYKGMGCIS